MGSRHTPAPWRIGDGEAFTDFSIYAEGCADAIGEAYGGWDDNGDSIPTAANARLMIAAPDLLEAAQMAHSALDQLMGDSDLPEDDSPEMLACQKLAAAIARAKEDDTDVI